MGVEVIFLQTHTANMGNKCASSATNAEPEAIRGLKEVASQFNDTCADKNLPWQEFAIQDTPDTNIPLLEVWLDADGVCNVIRESLRSRGVDVPKSQAVELNKMVEEARALLTQFK